MIKVFGDDVDVEPETEKDVFVRMPPVKEYVVRAVVRASKNPCTTCYGYGLWALGDASPMGPLDAAEGLPTIECPECGKNENPIKRESK